VKCWTSAGHWTERERERDVVDTSMCVCILHHMWRERQYGPCDDEGFNLHCHRTVAVINLEENIKSP
jgi:hypothetical protein